MDHKLLNEDIDKNNIYDTTSVNKISYCMAILKKELELRKSKNSMYSMRAFARDLEIGSTSLSDILANKRKISKKNLIKIENKLSLSPLQVKTISDEIRGDKCNGEEIIKLQMEEDTFRLIADWHYLAILNLANIKNSQADPYWISQRLGITIENAIEALERLQRLKMISVQKGKLIRIKGPLTTTREISSTAIKKHHKDNLNLAYESLEKDNISLREFSSTTMSIDIKNLPKAKELLMKTKRKVANLLETDDPNQVYVLSFQLFPLTKSGE